MNPLDTIERTVPFQAGDGMALNLVNVRGARPPTRGPVLLVHGAGVRGNLFRAPTPVNFVDALIAAGYDVWLENWRASIDVPPNPWTLDQAALYDHPAAVRTVVAETGCDRFPAVIHCQGSTSFTMSAIAGLVPQVRTIVSSAVSLHPVVPHWSQWKLQFAVPLVKLLTPYLDPRWGDRAPSFVPKLIVAAVRAVHHECDNDVCKMISFTYGAGFPALWSHALLDERTHDWLRHEFGAVPLRFFEQMRECVRAGRLMRFEPLLDLPADFAAAPPLTDARFVFVAGRENRCFNWTGQARSFAHFDRYRPAYHALRIFPRYGHLDVFLGHSAARDVFPTLLAALEQ